MKNLLTLFTLLLLGLTLACSGSQSTDQESAESTEQAEAATDESPAPAADERASRPSPPRQASATIGDASIVVDYSSPSVKGRQVWGGLVPYGQVWRTGANEATTFEVSSDIMVEGKLLPAGKYGLFTIPGENKWVVIFNKVWDQWGSTSYNEAEDALRVEVTPQNTEESTEMMSIDLEDGRMILRWEKIAVPVRLGSEI